MAFHYRLEHQDGTPAEPPKFTAAVPNWQAGDTIPLGARRSLRVIAVRPAKDPDENGVLIVEAV